MALLQYALLSVAELKEHLAIAGTGQDAVLESVINDTTGDLETYLQRQIVSRTGGDLVEYHTMKVDFRGLCVSDLRPTQWPILAITSVCEDTINWPRTYPVSSQLTANTDYMVVKGPNRDTLLRLSTGGGTRYWANGIRPIRLTYTAGYANAAAVPLAIKTQAKKYAALLWREIDRKIQGVQTQNDALGNFTRFAAAGITDQMKDALSGERRTDLYETGEAA